MPYIIAFVIIIVAAGALLLFREPMAEPMAINSNQPAEVSDDTRPESQNNNVPDGFTPPTTPPPGANDSAAEPNAEETAEQVYSAEASYFTPKRTEHEMLVTLTLNGEIVTDAEVNYDGGVAATPNHSAFDAAYREEVIGQPIDDIYLSRVGGASLTSEGFNDAVEKIQNQRS